MLILLLEEADDDAFVDNLHSAMSENFALTIFVLVECCRVCYSGV